MFECFYSSKFNVKFSINFSTLFLLFLVKLRFRDKINFNQVIKNLDFY